jgi:hypothetical protein
MMAGISREFAQLEGRRISAFGRVRHLMEQFWYFVVPQVPPVN